MNQPMLYIVSCGAPLARRVGDGIDAARTRGWDVALIPTAASDQWVDHGKVEIPAERVVTDHRTPDEAKRLPPADAIAVVPLTFNSLNAWATGLASTYPLATLCAALGAGTPTAAVPFAKHDLAGHPAWLASLAVLRYAGVQIVDPTNGALGRAEPIDSGTGDRVADDFRWSWVLDALAI